MAQKNRVAIAFGTGNRWNKWPTSRFRGRVVKLEDFERTLRVSLLDRYARAGYRHVVTGSTQYGRALTEPGSPHHDPRWRAMTAGISLIQTVSAQLWLDRDGTGGGSAAGMA